MKAKATCRKCGYIVEEDLEEVDVDTNGLAEALRFLRQQAQEHHHPEVSDSFNWRLEWIDQTP